jgi:hypothetical protein
VDGDTQAPIYTGKMYNLSYFENHNHKAAFAAITKHFHMDGTAPQPEATSISATTTPSI